MFLQILFGDQISCLFDFIIIKRSDFYHPFYTGCTLDSLFKITWRQLNKTSTENNSDNIVTVDLKTYNLFFYSPSIRNFMLSVFLLVFFGSNRTCHKLFHMKAKFICIIKARRLRFSRWVGTEIYKPFNFKTRSEPIGTS